MQEERSYRFSLALISIAFLLWGVFRALDDILIALFRSTAPFGYAVSMLIHFSFFLAYLLVSMPVGVLARRWGYRTSIAGSTLLMAFGMAVCVPGARSHSFPLCLAGVFLTAAGIAALQTSANPCIALLGPARSATHRLLVVQSFNSLGCVLGPLTGPLLFPRLLRASGTYGIVFPGIWLGRIYAALTVCLVLLCLGFPLLFKAPSAEMRGQRAFSIASFRSSSRLVFGFVAIFLYVGSEATILGHTIPYLTRAGGAVMQPKTAAMLLSVYWGACIVGRMGAVTFLRRMNAQTLLRIAASMAFFLLQGALFLPGALGATCLLATGLCNAVIFPTIFSLSVSGLAKSDLPAASGLLTTAISGGALLPLVGGWMADHFGIAAALYPPSAAYLILGVCSAIWLPLDYHLPNPQLAVARTAQ
ncbi:MAG: MFS transporter [Acidobacteriaceae bacterium]